MTGFNSKRQASKEGTHPDPWRDAVDNELVCLHLGTADSFPTAQEALEALIDWHVQVALDPEVSSDAQALIAKGRSHPAPAPGYTEGHCAEKAKKGGCQLHNLHCGYPACDRRPAAPAVAEPLTNEKISACSKGHMTRNGFARAIEAAHGIKGSKT